MEGPCESYSTEHDSVSLTDIVVESSVTDIQ